MTSVPEIDSAISRTMVRAIIRSSQTLKFEDMMDERMGQPAISWSPDNDPWKADLSVHRYPIDHDIVVSDTASNQSFDPSSKLDAQACEAFEVAAEAAITAITTISASMQRR